MSIAGLIRCLRSNTFEYTQLPRESLPKARPLDHENFKDLI